MLSTPSLSVKGDLFLGNHPSGLSALARAILQKSTPGRLTDRLSISLHVGWYDLTFLIYLAQILNIARDRFAQIDLHFVDAAERKFRFLWQCGFWSYVRANMVGSSIYCHPDNWLYQPEKGTDASLNFTQIFHLNLDLDPDRHSLKRISITDNIVADFVKRFDEDLRSMACFPFVQETDAMQTREYLYVLLWELVHNSFIHSGSKDVAIAGQVFVSPQSLKPPGGNTDAALPMGRLSSQYQTEVSNTRLPERKRWLNSHHMQSFLMLSCTDCGKGIPESMRLHSRISASSADTETLRAAFSPWSSSRRIDPDVFDMHGLSQVVRLVDDYDGYLFVQSGQSLLESSRSAHLQPASIPKGHEVAGTLFQILLPLTPKPPSRSEPQRVFGLRHGGPEMAEPQKRAVFVAGEIRRAGFDVPPTEEAWPQAANAVCLVADRIAADPLYLDLTGLPCDRQFVSYVLRKVRRNRPHLQGVIAINVPVEIGGFARAMQKLDTNIYETEDKSWKDLDQELATALSRGEKGSLLLLLPLVLFSAEGLPNIIWLGLGDFPNDKRQAVEAALNYLVATDGAQCTWEQLLYEVRDHNAQGQYELQEFSRLCRAIARCNPSLFERSDREVRARLSFYELERRSLSSLEAEVRTLVSQMRHERPHGQEHFLYSLAWHETLEKRFRKSFYQTWTVLENSQQRHACALYLAQKAHLEVPSAIGAAIAVVAATPSAGLLGRELAAVLGIPFYEAASFYDIDRRPWLPHKLNGPAIVVDDVIDTGTLSERLIAHLRSRGSSCACVIALLDNADAIGQRVELGCPLVTGMSVQLGIPAETDFTNAIRSESYFEIDPHTLEPVPPRTGEEIRFPREQADRLNQLAYAQALRLGHFAHSDHHYKIYFSLADALAFEGTQHSLLEWVSGQVQSFAEQFRAKRVTVVYPYYSPIHKLVSRLQLGIPNSKVELDFVVAKPRQLTGNRTGYSLARKSGAGRECLRHVIFLDDGLASGGTLAAIIDEVLASDSQAFRALIVFDRIGQQPRRHLRSIKSYRNESRRAVVFSLESYVTPNLRSHYSNDCPDCKIRRAVAEACSKHPGFLRTAHQALDSLLDPVVVSAERTPVPSALEPDDVLSVLNFHHAALSDRPSPREIQRALDGRKGMARLECLKTVLADERIFRQIIDRSELRRWIVEDVSSPSVTADGRARFVLSLTACLEIDQGFVRDVLTRDLPDAFRQLAMRGGDSLDAQSLARHFDDNENEFNALAASLYLAYGKLSNQQGSDVLAEWINLLGSKSFYRFPLETLFRDRSELPVPEAEHLIASFVGTYADHDDSFRLRLSYLRAAINNGMADSLKEHMPPELVRYLIDMIERTQEMFMSWAFGSHDLTTLRNACHRWQVVGDVERLPDMISQHFLSESPVSAPATIMQLLGDIAPRVDYLFDRAWERYSAAFPKGLRRCQVIPEAIDSNLRVLGKAERLSYILFNLLENAHQAWQRSRERKSDLPEQDLRMLVRLDGAGRVRIEVIDNIPCQGGVEQFFVGSGGLPRDRSDVERWGGQLTGEARDQAGKTMRLDLRRVSGVCDLGDPQS